VVVIPECAPDLLVTTGDEQADDPESIARWLAAFDAIPPLEMTPDEEAEWRAAREAQRAFEIANFEENIRRIEALNCVGSAAPWVRSTFKSPPSPLVSGIAPS